MMALPDEKIAVVDKNSNTVIGYKLFNELTDDDCWRIVAVWVENSKGHVLLQQRVMSKKTDPGLWTPAAVGTVDGDDDYLSTAIRETEEEIGVTGVELLPTKLLWHDSQFGSRWCQGYKAIVDWPIKNFVIQREEVADLAWFNKQQIIDEILAGSPKYPVAARAWLDLFNLL